MATLLCVFAQVAGLQHRVVELETVESQNREVHRQQCDQRQRETAAQLMEEREGARSQVKELAAQVGLAESRVQVLEEQLGLADTKRRELELKLAGLCSALRRTASGQTRLFSAPGSHRRSPSPRRNQLHVKGMVACHHALSAVSGL